MNPENIQVHCHEGEKIHLYGGGFKVKINYKRRLKNMRTIISKKVATLAIFMITIVPVFSLALNANAQSSDDLLWGGMQGDVEESLGLGNTDPRAMAASVVRILLGFLGIIAVLIVLWGGFKWMTAGGNEDQISQAKKILAAGVVGLIIILMAFGLAQMVVNELYDATGAGAGA